ncbi:MAG TPA: substrate-binding domain-containing protein [Pseudonocardia sp.]|nr:substrate-binding domain-containing protein [Pseudonocardia sp.]
MTWGDVVQFLVALLGVLLVGITPNPPVTFRDWLQILVGAALTAAMATAAVRDWVRRSASQALSSGPADRLRDWRLWAWVLAAGLLAAVVAVAVPFLFDVARGLSYRVLGCPPAVQLRVLAEPETVATARELAIRYERWTADGNHGCPTAQAYVFAAEPATIVQKVATTDGWSDATQSLRAVGPRPDVWLASTRREVDAATTAGGAIAESLPVAHSPLVLAVPAGAPRPTGLWPQVLRQLEEAGVAVVRPDPRTTQVGRLAAVLLYGRDTTYPDAARSLAVERSLDAARGTLPIGGAAELLCPRRDAGTGAATAVVATEQDVARYNQGAALGGTCGPTPGRPAPDRRIEAVYPDDTADQDLQLVRLRWTDPVLVQERASEALGRWLRSHAGRRAVVETGLRPTGILPPPAAPLTGDYGVTPALATSPEPVSVAQWTDAYAAHEAAQLPSRLLVLVDTSSSMAKVVPGGTDAPPDRTRATVAADAVGAGLAGLQRGDEFGLWLFPGGTPAAYVDAVPVGLRDEGLAPARDALARVQPGGGTPLFRAVTDGVTALSARDETASGERIGTRALIVLTDGRDNASGTTLDDAVGRVTGRGVRIVVVALGGVRCAEAGLATLADATGGECVESDPADVPGRVQEFVIQLRGGRS